MATSLTSRGQALHHWRDASHAELRQPFNVIAPGSVLQLRFRLCIGWLHVSVRDNKVRSSRLLWASLMSIAQHQWCSRRKHSRTLLTNLLSFLCEWWKCYEYVYESREHTDLGVFFSHLTLKLLFLSHGLSIAAFLDHKTNKFSFASVIVLLKHDMKTLWLSNMQLP